MGATGIEWTRGPNGEQGYTFNPWIGCTKVSGACDHCYAEKAAVKLKVDWGPHAKRRGVSDGTWAAPLGWDRQAAAAGERRRVFCASMADVLDNHSSIEQAWRDRLFALIAATPNLDWMLLTKRPQNARKFLPYTWFVKGGWPPNVWFGFTAERQHEFNQRWIHAQQVPAPIIFVSGEPLLEEIILPSSAAAIALFIGGGESGTLIELRDTPIDIFRSMLAQCRALGIPYFQKQLAQLSARAAYKKPALWPEDLRVREHPRMAA